MVLGIDYQALADEQKRDPEIAAHKSASLKLQLIPFGVTRVLCDTSIVFTGITA